MCHHLPWVAAVLLVLSSGCLHTEHGKLPAPPVAQRESSEDLRGGETALADSTYVPVPESTTVPFDPGVQLVRHDAPVAAIPELRASTERPARRSGLSRLQTPILVTVRPESLRTPPMPAHAPDYRWLVGVLTHDPQRDCWGVRYTDECRDERCGGIVELVDPGPMDGFCPGQMVRVEGEFLDPAPREITPTYRVRSLAVLLR
jgi:hypothetical protein